MFEVVVEVSPCFKVVDTGVAGGRVAWKVDCFPGFDSLLIPEIGFSALLFQFPEVVSFAGLEVVLVLEFLDDVFYLQNTISPLL